MQLEVSSDVTVEAEAGTTDAAEVGADVESRGVEVAAGVGSCVEVVAWAQQSCGSAITLGSHFWQRSNTCFKVDCGEVRFEAHHQLII